LRRDWESLLRAEWEAGAQGEAGWSAEWRKRALKTRDIAARSRSWREYCCESFCDTGAFAACGNSAEMTLSRRRLRDRIGWFRAHFDDRALPI
jgi:hypothetical protein